MSDDMSDTKRMTWAEVLAVLQTMTPEQLAHEAIVLPDGDGAGGRVLEMWVQTADQVCTDDVWEPRDEYLRSAIADGIPKEEAEAEPIVSKAGQPYLIFERTPRRTQP